MKDVYLLHKAPDTIATEKINELTDVYQAGLTAFRILNRNGILRDKYKQYGRDKYLELVSKGTLIKPTDYAPFVPAGVRRIINKAIHPDPEKRFRSAREFRKSLEAQVYPGYWDINADGDLEGVVDGNRFMFERRATKTGKYELVALRKNLASQRITHVTAHCQKADTPKDLERKEVDFMHAVIKGEC